MHSLSKTPLKIGYFADGIWAHNAFKKLIEHFQIGFITPRFDTKDTTLYHFAKTHNIPYIKSPNINSPEFLEQILPLGCDIFVSMSFNQIFKEPLISTPRLKTINCHAGKLPFYRGRNVLNWALINDEKEFGISVHYVDSGIDTGDIILQRTYQISDKDDYTSLLTLAHTECASVLFEALQSIQNGTVMPIRQDSIHKVGFYCPARIQGDEWINWHNTSRTIFNFIRALNAPSLGAKTALNNQEIRIFKAEMIDEAPNYIATPGVVVGVESKPVGKPNVLIKTLDSTLRILIYECAKSQTLLKIGDRLVSMRLGGGATNTFCLLLLFFLFFIFLFVLLCFSLFEVLRTQFIPTIRSSYVYTTTSL